MEKRKKERRSKGRPANSIIRQNIVEILSHLGVAYGYQISKLYHQIFHSATRRVIYYHLKKGLELGVFMVDKVKQEGGEFSWGNSAEKIYYRLGPTAEPKGLQGVAEFFGKGK